MLQSEPWASLQAIVVSRITFGVWYNVFSGRIVAIHVLTAEQSLLGAYENLFTEPCVVCGRVLSVEVHTPPAVRVRKDPGEDSPSEWGVYHVACKWR